MIDYVVQRRSPFSGAWMGSFVTDDEDKAHVLAQGERRNKHTDVRILKRETTCIAVYEEKGQDNAD